MRKMTTNGGVYILRNFEKGYKIITIYKLLPPSLRFTNRFIISHLFKIKTIIVSESFPGFLGPLKSILNKIRWQLKLERGLAKGLLARPL